MRRAARLDGWLSAYMPRDGGDRELTPELLREGIDWLRERRAARGRSMGGYDVVAEGTTPADRAAAAEIVRPWAEAGATWWIDADSSDMDPGRVRAAALERLRAGPPHL